MPNYRDLVSGLKAEDAELILAIEAGIPPKEDAELVLALEEFTPKLEGFVESVSEEVLQETEVVVEAAIAEAELEAVVTEAVVTEAEEDVEADEVPTPQAAEQPAPKKRGRHTMYDLTPLKVSERLEYHNSLASGRVLSSLRGTALGRKFQAKEVKEDGKLKVFITRLQ